MSLHSYSHKHLKFHDSYILLKLTFLWVFLEGERPALEDTIQSYCILPPAPYPLSMSCYMIMCDGIAVVYPSEKSNRQFGTSSHSPDSKSCIYLWCRHNQSLKWLSCCFSSRFLQKCSHVFISWFVFSNKIFKIRHLSLFYISIQFQIIEGLVFIFYIFWVKYESTIPIGSYRKLYISLCVNKWRNSFA